MAFDYKKEYKEFYLPPEKPEITEIPAMTFLAVDGKGDPNTPDGEYRQAIALLYGMAYTIKMSRKGQHRMAGFFDFVVPPLEGFWEQKDTDGFDSARKQDFCWTSVIRIPEFVTQEDFLWAREEAEKKKKADFSPVYLLHLTEGTCVQMLHTGSFDSEGPSVERMRRFSEENGYREDFSPQRRHHEIYLSDARKVPQEKWRTVLRHPVIKR